jgi:hypothetical protein
MKTPVLALVCAALVLAGCGGIRESRMNPMNWFGESRASERPDLGRTSDTIDNRPMVPEVSTLVIERTSSGAIIRAEAVMPSGGWWDAELLSENFGRPIDGVLTLRFVAAAPRTPVPAPNAAARTITAVYAINQADLDTIAEIVVAGEGNARRIRR